MASELNVSFEWRSQRFYDASLGLKAFAEHQEKAFKDVPQIISRELRSYLELVMEALEQRHGKPYPGGTGPKSLSRRSGHMLEYMKESIRVEGNSIATITGYLSVPGDRKIHENGGVLKPKKAKYLTIPLPAALNSNGTPKKPSARSWENTFVIRSKAGNLLIVQKRGAQIIPLYVLKTEVYIPPRLGLLETARVSKTILADKLTNAILGELRQ
jgi:hypothetical protein